MDLLRKYGRRDGLLNLYDDLNLKWKEVPVMTKVSPLKWTRSQKCDPHEGLDGVLLSPLGW